MPKFVLAFLGLLLAVSQSGCSDSGTDVSAEPLVRVYSARQKHLLQPILDRYSEATGVAIEAVYADSDNLFERIDDDSGDAPADLVISTDVGYLWQAADDRLLLPVQSDRLQHYLPQSLRADNWRWFGLSVHARTLVYSTARVKPAELKSYEDLADPKWRGRLCLRAGSSMFTQSLLAGMMASLGEERTEEVARGWLANLAEDPYGSDTKVMESIHRGVCDLGIVNTYYYARMIEGMPSLGLALFWPNQADRGVHINLTGAGISEHSQQPQLALQLLEWLASPAGQKQFAAINHEYPANPKAELSPLLKSWGSFKPDESHIEQAGKLIEEARDLIEQVEYL